ncbi:hypothetical protein KPB2_5360 [Klebsiella pneumoniae Kb677]|nr:hypothetical protein KPB2_5360 [Klebsiella pneumoniae Kb677]
MVSGIWPVPDEVPGLWGSVVGTLLSAAPISLGATRMVATYAVAMATAETVAQKVVSDAGANHLATFTTQKTCIEKRTIPSSIRWGPPLPIGEAQPNQLH